MLRSYYAIKSEFESEKVINLNLAAYEIKL